MSLRFSTIVYDLKDFVVPVRDTQLKISVVSQDNGNTVVLSAEHDTGSVRLNLIMNSIGICEFNSSGNDYKVLCSDIKDSYTAAHWDNGFYQYAPTNRLSRCAYDDIFRMSVVAKPDYLSIDADFPSSITVGGVETSFSDCVNVCQMLMCIAKLIARYTFEPWGCKVLDAVCPTLETSVPVLTTEQEEYLKKEYPVAFDVYMNGDAVSDVLDMLREGFGR